MTADQQTIAITMIVIGVIFIVVLFLVFRKRSTEPPVVTQIEVAHIVEPNLPETAAVGVIGFALILCSLVCMMNYITARSYEQQIIAVLFWIGNCIFWGVLLIAKLISQGRTSIIYRETTPTDYENQ